MKVKLISARLQTRHVVIKGVIDRRYKTGFRVMPEDYMGYELRLKLSNPESYFRVGENVLTQYGNFRVVNINHLNTSMDLIQYCHTERGDSFIFTPELEILSMGFQYREGSDYTKSLLQ